MKHNIFDTEDMTQNDVLSHADQEAIVELAKNRSVGTLQDAISIYCEQNKDTLAHGIDEIETLFPEYKDVYPGAPEKLTRDMGWVSTVMNKTHKSPISRIRTRQADVRGEDLNALGYKKGDKKKLSANVLRSWLSRMKCQSISRSSWRSKHRKKRQVKKLPKNPKQNTKSLSSH